MKSNLQEPIQTIQKSLDHLSQILGKQFSFPVSQASQQVSTKVTEVYPIVTRVEPFYIQKHHLDDRSMRDALNYREFDSQNSKKVKLQKNQKHRNHKMKFQEDDYGYTTQNPKNARAIHQRMKQTNVFDTKSKHSRKESAESQFQKYINKNSQLQSNRQIKRRAIDDHRFSFGNPDGKEYHIQQNDYYRDNKSSNATFRINKVIEIKQPEIRASKKTVLKHKFTRQVSEDSYQYRPKSNRKMGRIYFNNLKGLHKKIAAKNLCRCQLNENQFGLKNRQKNLFRSHLNNLQMYRQKQAEERRLNQINPRFFNRCFDSDTDSNFSQYEF